MAASAIARKQLARVFLSSSLRPVPPTTLPAASRSYNFYSILNAVDPNEVICGPCPKTQAPPSFPPLHHEYLIKNLRDGLHVCLYMAGVSKGNVKVWVEGDELIAEGIKEKDFEEEDDATTNTLLRYKMLGTDPEVYNLDAIKAKINNGMLNVFIPRIDQNAFVPRDKGVPMEKPPLGLKGYTYY